MLTTLALAAAVQSGGFYLHDGDRVTFYGDSITQAGGYEQVVELYVRTRFPGMDVRFTNAGWNGDRVNGGGGGDAATRIKLDFAPTKPTVVTCMLGMNDGAYTPLTQQKDDDFASGYAKLIDLMLAAAPKARYTLIQTSPYDDITRGDRHYNDVLLQMGAHVKELADKYKFGYVDFNAPLLAMLKQANSDNAQAAQALIPDRIHPSAAGHELMGVTLLKAWGAPSLVSDVEIDGRSGSVKKSDGAKVTKKGALEWDELDHCLPMPINFNDPLIRLTADQNGELDAVDREMLQIDNLETGTYSLSVDGHEVGKVSADDLGKGINLVKFLTPMLGQGFHIAALVQQRYSFQMERWRQIQRDHPDFKSTPAAVKALEAFDGDLVRYTLEAAKPTSHTFSITKVQQ
jgi:lysophospholipase L1-like esterase